MSGRVYNIEWLPQAEKQFKKIKDERLRERILESTEEIARNPLCGKPLRFHFKGTFSYRVGKLRLLYRPYRERLVIVVLRIDQRKDVYRIR